ncbi:MAG TPA: amidohydrolase family protein [Candidatus Limnocylindrales bacterium]|nr:amidohydrolase family protein [Candidatus Limnocylindrales bacterium]
MTTAADAIEQAGLLDGPHDGVNACLREARFIDHHVHSILAGQLSVERLVAGLSETDRADAAATGGIDHQLGVALRRWCAPLLGLEPHVEAEDWLRHRSRLDNAVAAASLLPSAGLEALFVDTGYRSAELLPVEDLARLAGADAEPVVRLEALAEDVAAAGVSASGFAAAYRDALATATRDAVGVKSIVAYRGGLDLDPSPPSAAEVVDHAGRWLASIAAGAPLRLTDSVLLRLVLWSGVDTTLPLQIHTGYGDSDLDLQRSDPLLLTGFIRATQGRTRILLLHTYPFHRQAGYLAQMFAHVYTDIGLGVNHTGIQSEQLVAEMLEVAPFRKILFSSDAWGLPELHLLGSWLFRRGLSRVLGRWVARGDWSVDDARQAIELIGSENARRVYGR